MASATLSAETRSDTGKGVARKLRAAGRVPGIIYGHAREPQALSLVARDLDKLLSGIAAGSTVVELTLGSATTKTLIREVAEKVVGTTNVVYQGVTIDVGKPFDRLTMAEAIHKYSPRYAMAELAKPEYLKVALASLDVEVFATDGVGILQLKLFEATTEDKLVQPTFIVAHPTDVSPLARANDANPAVTDRFELFIAGREIANGFSELNDPEDQAARFKGQVAAREAGDEDAMYYDADYIRAMEYGLPPTAGEGIGIDRLVMLLTDSPSIRDVILFPQLKREG